MDGVKEEENITGDNLHSLNEIDLDKIILEEDKLKIENEQSFSQDLENETKFNSEDSSVLNKELDQDEVEKQLKENRCKRLMHLLKRSRLYAAELNNQIKSEGMGVMRKKKANTNKDKSLSAKSELFKSSSFINEEINENADSDETVSSVPYEIDVDFFENTYKTCLGFTVSSYQPNLVEGGVMRDYQLKGLQWLTTLFANGVNGILADEMGLGKTLQVIALICSLIENGIGGPFLIIAPLSTISNWMGEFRKFAPQVPTMLFHGSKKDRKSLIHEISKPVTVLGRKVMKVVITSYEVTLFERKPLSKIMWPYVIVDEGHRMKNHNSQLSRAMRGFTAVGKLLITGTPLQNDLSELWSLLNFIIPEVFNSLEVFQSWFDVQQLESDGAKFMEENYNINIISTLQQILIPFLLRRQKKDVSINLPPKKEILVYCPMTPLQKKLYEATVDRSIERLLNRKRPNNDVNLMEPLPKRACVLYRKFQSLDRNERDSVEYEKYREKYCLNEDNQNDFAVNITMRNPQMQLRKIVNHPYLIQFPLIPGTDQLKIDEDLVKSSGKLLVVDSMLAKLKSQGHKVIVFSTFKVMLDILENLAEMRGYSYCRFDGSTKLEEREESIYQFNTDPDVFVFFISMRAGGLGINLTGADTIIIYDSDWNPHINLQSQDRCHRIGQTKPVVIYNLCVRGTVDEQIVERGKAKRRLEKVIIQKGKFTKGVQDMDCRFNLMDLQELKALFSSTDYDNIIHSNGSVFTDEELEALLDRSDMTNDVTVTKSTEKENNNEKVFKLLSREST